MSQTKRLGVPLAKRLSRLMDEQGLTVRELATRADLGHNTIHLLRKGEGGQAGIGTIYNVAQALGVSPAWLAYDIGPQTKPDSPSAAIKEAIAALPAAERSALLAELRQLNS